MVVALQRQWMSPPSGCAPDAPRVETGHVSFSEMELNETHAVRVLVRSWGSEDRGSRRSDRGVSLVARVRDRDDRELDFVVGSGVLEPAVMEGVKRALAQARSDRCVHMTAVRLEDTSPPRLAATRETRVTIAQDQGLGKFRSCRAEGLLLLAPFP
jgi:hypothetical protein